MKRLLIIALAIGLSIGIALPAKSASEKPKSGGTLTFSVRKEIRIKNPLVRTRSIDNWIRRLMFEPLVTVDTKGKVHPTLAESWEVSDNYKLYTFRIRKGVKFHDGQEMTAEDAKFAMDYTMNPKNGATGFSRLAIVKRVEAPDKYTLKVYLKEPSATFVISIAHIKAFSVIPKGSLEQGVPRVTDFPPGTGAWKFVEWKQQRHMIFERNDNYWGQKPYLDKVVFKPIRNGSVRITALRAGDVDIIERAPMPWAQRILAGKLKGIKLAESPNGGFRQIKFNVTDPPFNNSKLRQAVAYAIDRREILNAAWYGFGEPSDQRYPKGHSWHMDGLPSPWQDLNRAKALLQESGYKGEAIKLLVNNITNNLTEAITIQAQLKKIGLKIELDSGESGKISALKSKGKFAMNTTGGTAIFANPADAYRQLKCERQLIIRAANETGYCDKEMDRLLKQLDVELDVEKRREFVKQIVTKVNQDLPMIHVGYVPRFYGFRDYVKGFEDGGDGSWYWWGGGLNYVWLDK